MKNALGGKVPKSANRIIFNFTKIKTCQAAACISARAFEECAKRDFLVSHELQQQHAASLNMEYTYIVKILPNTLFTEKDQGIWCDVLFPNNSSTLQIFVVPCIMRITLETLVALIGGRQHRHHVAQLTTHIALQVLVQDTSLSHDVHCAGGKRVTVGRGRVDARSKQRWSKDCG